MEIKMTYAQKFKLEIVKFIQDMTFFVEEFEHSKKESELFRKAINIEIPENFLNDISRGLLIFDNKKADVSTDTLKVIQSFCCSYFKDDFRNVGFTLKSINTIEKSIEDSKDNQVYLYKFLEAVYFSEIVNEIGHTFSHHCYSTPIFAIASIINPEKVNEIISSTDKVIFELEELTGDFWNVINTESNGEKMYKKLREISNSYQVVHNKKSA